MESKTNYTLVGLTVLLLLAGLILTGLWLSVGFDQKKYRTYVVYMKEAAAGINEDSLVKYNGVRVGTITKIELSKRDPQTVKLTLSVVDGTPINRSTRATLVMQGITGNTYLGLSSLNSDPTPLQKKPGQRYPVIPYVPSFFAQLETNFKEMSAGVKRMFTEENARYINKTLANLQSVTNVFAENNANLNKTLKELPSLVHSLQTTVQQFSEMASEVSSAGKQVSSTMRAGRNTIDKISQQAVPPAIVLLRRLDAIAANLEKVSSEIRQNPAVIIRGSAPAKLGPGEHS